MYSSDHTLCFSGWSWHINVFLKYLMPDRIWINLIFVKVPWKNQLGEMLKSIPPRKRQFPIPQIPTEAGQVLSCTSLHWHTSHLLLRKNNPINSPGG